MYPALDGIFHIIARNILIDAHQFQLLRGICWDLQGTVECDSGTSFMLAAYVLQADFGDYQEYEIFMLFFLSLKGEMNFNEITFVYLFIYLFIYSSIPSFIPSFIHPSIHPSIHSSIHPSIHPFIHLFVMYFWWSLKGGMSFNEITFIYSFIYLFIYSVYINSKSQSKMCLG